MNFKLTTLTLLLVFWVFSVAKGQRLLPAQQADRLFENTGEIYFSFRNEPGINIGKITRMIAIDYVDGKTVKAFANKRQFQEFASLGIPITILKRPAETADVQMLGSGENFDRTKITAAYPTYPQYEALMARFANDYPAICKMVNLGTLPSGRKILALKITDNVNVREYEPQFLYTSTMHGDETAGYPMMLNLIEYLLTNYGSNQRVTRMVNNMEIWINPLANPDGTYRGGNQTVAQATRFNANNVDLNRNYPDPKAGFHPDGNPHQPETKIFMAWADTMDLVMAANLHGGIELVNYPWDTWATLTADQSWWRRQSFMYADTAQANSPEGYFTANIPGGDAPGVTNGFRWYEVAGGRQDYMNWWRHCREFTLELSNTKIISNNQIVNHWNYNKASLLNYMEAALQGIKGIVTDSCTGAPIKAKIFVNGHDFDSSFVYTSLPLGNFHRPIEAGTWSVTISANGYLPKTFNGLTVTNQSEIEIVTALAPAPPRAAAIVTSPFSCTGSYAFKDVSGNATSWNWNFGDGNSSTLQNPEHTYTTAGNFLVSLRTSNCRGTSTFQSLIPVNPTINRPPVTQNDTALSCGAFSLDLQASAPGTLHWFASPSGGTALFSGQNFSTPPLRETKTYYVQSTILGTSENAGPESNIIGNGGFFTGNTYHNLIFDAHADFRLVAVTLYTNLDGNKTIELRNAQGQLLQSAIVNARAGENRVTLNFRVPKGSGLRLGASGGSRLYRNISGASYPYEVKGLLSIIGNSAGEPDYYYYFYDWEVQSLCESERTPAMAVSLNNLNLQTTLTTAEFTVCQFDTIRLQASTNQPGSNFNWLVNSGIDPQLTGSTLKIPANNVGSLRFEAIAINGEDCLINPIDTSAIVTVSVIAGPAAPIISWNAPVLSANVSTGITWTKDGQVIPGSTNQASVMPNGPGTYAAFITDANICRSRLSNEIILLVTELAASPKSPDWALYPNPAQEKLSVTVTRQTRLLLINALGQTMDTWHVKPGKQTFSISTLPTGIYQLIDPSTSEWLRFEKVE